MSDTLQVLFTEEVTQVVLIESPAGDELLVKFVDETLAVTISPTGERGERGPGAAPGGTLGQLQFKASDADYDVVWRRAQIDDVEGLQTAIDAAATDADLAAQSAAQAAVDAAQSAAIAAEVSDRVQAIEGVVDGLTDLDTRLDTIDTTIAAETAARIAADTAEATTRATNDTTLAGMIDGVASDLLDETATRAGADTALGDRITTLEANPGGVSSFNGRAGAVEPEPDDYAISDITGLTDALADETTARADADTAEETARANADAALQGNIDAEATARANADTAEASARVAADVNEAAARSDGDLDISARLSALESNTATPAGTYIVSGGNVALVAGLTYRVGAAVYYIANTRYTSPETNVTLDASDAVNDRIDVLAFDVTGPVKVTGTAAANPLEPSLDPGTQLRITAVYLPATSITVGTTTPIYSEGVEWVATPSGGTIAIGSLNNPRSGTKSIEGTNAAAGDYVDFVTASFDPATKNAVVLYVRNKAAWATKKAITLTWFNGATQKGQTVTVPNNSYGFNSQQFTGYQQIVVPISVFAIPAASAVTKLRVGITGTGASVGFYWDDFQLQAGIAQPVTQNALVFKGDWSAAVAYLKNDVVMRYGAACIALQPSTNQDPFSVTRAPREASTYWQPTALWNFYDGALILMVQRNFT